MNKQKNKNFFLVVGLGNPGQKYENTWHNLGRMSLTFWQKNQKFPKFLLEKKFNSLVSKGVFGNKELVLALPETFMNKSGQAVKKILSFYKIPLQNLIIVHDDADLEKEILRISQNRGTAGHKGLDSIVANVKTKNFIRIRIGVRPKNYLPGSKSLGRFVLKKFTKNETKTIGQTIEKTGEAIEMILKQGLEKAMSKFN